MSPTLRHLLALPVLALATAGCWWGWMAWDTEYQIDPKTDVASGPYEAWQVIGCVLCLLALGLIGSMLLNPFAVSVVMPIAFTVAWSITSFAADDTGLAGVGAIMILIGMSMATPLVALVGHFMGRRLRPSGQQVGHGAMG